MNDNTWVLRYFTYDHLPEGPLRECSKRFALEAEQGIKPKKASYGDDYTALDVRLEALEEWCTTHLPNNPEREMALNKVGDAFDYISLRYLLEAKDCAVRSLLPISNAESNGE